MDKFITKNASLSGCFYKPSVPTSTSKTVIQVKIKNNLNNYCIDKNYIITIYQDWKNDTVNGF